MTSRRHFLAAAAASPLLAQVRGRSANDQVQIAIIGSGSQGTGYVQSSIAGGAKLVAASDIYQGRLTRVYEVFGKDVFVTRDYREVLARPDVDAVIIATPDHWHVKVAIDAMNAAKDVYLEKPMVQLIGDGQPLVEAQRKTGRILQVGSQRVSSIVYQKAQELLQSGAIGQLNMVEAWWDRNSAIGAWQYSIPPDATRENIDWFFFSSRRRHTRSLCDWSSDVCSSDLADRSDEEKAQPAGSRQSGSRAPGAKPRLCRPHESL